MRRRELQPPLSTRPPPRISETRMHKPESVRTELEEEDMREISTALWNSYEPILLCDFTGRITKANPAALSALGMTTDELRTKNLCDLVPESQSRAVFISLQEIMANGAEKEIRRFEFTTREGQIVIAMRGSLGIKKIVSLARDVTGFVYQQEELRRTAALDASAQVARKAGHDLRNLLNPAAALAEHFLRLDPQNFRPENIATIKKIALSSSEAISTAHKLLEELMFVCSPGPKQIDDVDINPILNVLVDRMETSLSSNEAKYTFFADFCPSPFLVRGDRLQLDRAFMNIIVNAIDAMPGGGTLSVQTENVIDTSGKWLRITISDTGHGMSPEVMARMDEPDFSTKGQRGTGLGLIITTKTISEHGGGIWVSSEQGEGTSFEIMLPAKK
jgi:PAS domain S-box-containing protein